MLNIRVLVADIDGLVRSPLTFGDVIATRAASLLAANKGENSNWAARRSMSISSIKASGLLSFLAFFFGWWHSSCVSNVNILRGQNAG